MQAITYKNQSSADNRSSSDVFARSRNTVPTITQTFTDRAAEFPGQLLQAAFAYQQSKAQGSAGQRS